MAISYSYARQFIGQPVCAQCHDGIKHYGIVREVTTDGIWLEPLPRRAVVTAGKTTKAEAVTADKPGAVKGENVYYPYPYGFGFGRFFLPFLALLALTPLLFGPYWW
ncbi:hypothetical protein [Effusibacillus consociatus]|uniref:Cytochrome C n=1 Tax=Effusibacillus consociatus TaxID=1117041 RepID=A0ABV9Q9S5_9BACL